MGQEIEGIEQIDVEKLKESLVNDKEVIIDVREIEEYVSGHIPRIPLLPMSQIENYINDLDQSKEYILVCRSGRRSHEVAKFFNRCGISKVKNFSGGMLTWNGDLVEGEERVITNIRDLYKK